MIATPETRPATPRDLLFVSTPALWPAWPFLPLVRESPEGGTECGLLYDCWSVGGRPGYSATVFLCNLFELPRGEDAFLALPRAAYDTAEELLGGGWRVD